MAAIDQEQSFRGKNVSAMLFLEDGRVLHRSNIGYCGMINLIAREVAEPYSKLQVWLSDIADRTPPFCEFDIRGLPEAERGEFWEAAQRAGVLIRAKYGYEELPENAWAAESLFHLLRMHESILAGEPPSKFNDLHRVVPYSGEPENLDFLWSDEKS